RVGSAERVHSPGRDTRPPPNGPPSSLGSSTQAWGVQPQSLLLAFGPRAGLAARSASEETGVPLPYSGVLLFATGHPTSLAGKFTAHNPARRERHPRLPIRLEARTGRTPGRQP